MQTFILEFSLGKAPPEAPTTRTPPRTSEKNDRDAPPVAGQRLSFTPIKSPEHKRVKLESQSVQVLGDFYISYKFSGGVFLWWLYSSFP